MANWNRQYDQFALSEACRKLMAMAKRDPGKQKHVDFKGVRLHAKLIKAGEPNGDGEEWKVGLSVKQSTWVVGWMWEMFIWALPVVFRVDDMLDCEKYEAKGRKITSKEYTLKYRYDLMEAWREFEKQGKIAKEANELQA